VLPNVCLQHIVTSTLFTTQSVALANFDYSSLINRKLVTRGCQKPSHFPQVWGDV